MKIFLFFVAVFTSLLIIVPNSELHSAKVSKLVEDNTTLSGENAAKNPDLVVHKIKKEWEQKLRDSKTKTYELTKDKNRLLNSISASFSEINFLKDDGNNKLQEWAALDSILRSKKLEMVKISQELKKIESPDYDSTVDNSKAIKKFNKLLSSLERDEQMLKFDIDKLNIEMVELKRLIANKENLAANEKRQLEKTLDKTKHVLAQESHIREQLFKIRSVEIDVNLAGHDLDLTEEEAIAMQEDIAEIETIKELVEQQDIKFLSGSVAGILDSNEELLAKIHQEGF